VEPREILGTIDAHDIDVHEKLEPRWQNPIRRLCARMKVLSVRLRAVLSRGQSVKFSQEECCSHQSAGRDREQDDLNCLPPARVSISFRSRDYAF